MADKYDKNGYNSSDFKRNSNQDAKMDNDDQQDGEEPVKINEKAGEYMRELLSEKIKLNTTKFPLSSRLIDQEVTRVQTSGRVPPKDTKYMDVYREKPVKLSIKVLVPIKEHPKFNFVGKLLGPKGNTMKHLQEETMCKMAVLGRGSMRDRQKEEELRNSLDPKYSHLSDELHVEISALAPPAEAHARIAYALAEVKKYLIPDAQEPMWQNQMKMIERQTGTPQRTPLRPAHTPDQGAERPDVRYRACTVTPRSLSYRNPIISGASQAGPSHPPHPPHSAPPRAPRMPPAHAHAHAHAHAPVHMGRAMPPKVNKVFSILDRARTAMESTYSYEDQYAAPEPQARGPPRGAPEPEFYYERGQHERFYEEDTGYYKEEPREFKASARDVGTRRPQPHPHAPRHYARASPYARPPK